MEVGQTLHEAQQQQAALLEAIDNGEAVEDLVDLVLRRGNDATVQIPTRTLVRDGQPVECVDIRGATELLERNEKTLRRHDRPGELRFHVNYTPTYSSWPNQVEIWFNLITQQAIRRGSFTSTTRLVHKIDQFVADRNPKARPFAWVAAADSILDRLQRLLRLMSGTIHQSRSSPRRGSSRRSGPSGPGGGRR